MMTALPVPSRRLHRRTLALPVLVALLAGAHEAIALWRARGRVR